MRPDGKGGKMGVIARWEGWPDGGMVKWMGFTLRRGDLICESGQLGSLGPMYVVSSVLQSHQLLFASEYRIFCLQNCS